MRKAILILICTMMTVSWASWAQAQSASSSYEDEAMGYIEAGEEAEAEGDYASACSYYGEAWGKFDWVHDALIEESLTTVERDAYGNVTNETLESNLRIASQNGAKAYDLKVAACARANSGASAPAPEPEPAPAPVKLITANEAAAYWMQQAKDEYAAGDGIEACVSLRKSATLYSMLKGDYSQVNTDPDILKRVEENLQITSETLRLDMHCPHLAEEMTAAFAYDMAQVNSAQADKTELQGDDASRTGDEKNACRLYSEALESLHLAEAWIDRMKTADSHDAVYEGFYESVLQSLKNDADEASGKVEKVCPAAA